MTPVTRPKLSVVVSTYGRTEHIKSLVESVASNCPNENYEIVVVSSDAPDSPKIDWLQRQQNLRIIAADMRTGPRLKSLYYYENLGIKAATGDWIFVTNDDTKLDPYFYADLLPYQNFDILAVKGHLAEPGLGQRFPVIGTLRRPGETESSPLYLYDFTVIRPWVYKAVGYLDEQIDWFGKGWDLSLKCEFVAYALGARIKYDTNLCVEHVIAPEGRTPPPCGRDFNYIKAKWDRWCQENPGYDYTCPF